MQKRVLYYPSKITKTHADLAHLVERHLAKVEVAGSSPVIRSKQNPLSKEGGFLFVLFTIHYSLFIVHFLQADFE